MRFLVDECTGPAVARWLEEQGHEVFSVYDAARGSEDDDILRQAYNEGWILITNDRDFGEKIFRENTPHRGVIFLRLQDERARNKIQVLARLFQLYSDQIAGRFVVVSETQVRFAGTIA
jgi:predicted nuclease of predicted toxin-antitoxin system